MAFIAQFAMAQNVIWGDQPGQGDFDGGLNGWTLEVEDATRDSNWLWTPDGNVGNGSLAGANTAIESPTVSNGAMTLNYDFYISGGDIDVVYGLTQPYPVMVSHLISPEIDLSNATSNFLSVEFYQLTRKLNATGGDPLNHIRFSQDGGLTWFGDENMVGVDANPSVAANEAPNNSQTVINIPGNIDLNLPLQIRFTYSGDFYYWVLDDIKLVERVPYELAANSFFSITPNLTTPEGQMADAGFLIDVKNNGSEAMTNVVANFDITSGGAVVYSDSLLYNTVGADSLAENQPFPGTFPTDLTQGAYVGTYTVSGDSTENNPDDNSQSFDFVISDTTFAKDLGPTRTISPGRGNWADGERWSWAYGNHYLVPNGDGMFARSVSFSLAIGDPGTDTDISGGTVFVTLYEWDDSNNYDGVAEPDERVALGQTVYFIESSTNQDNIITVPLPQPNGDLDAIPLKDNGSYMAMVEYISSDDETTMNMGGARVSDYGARTFQDGFTDSTLINYSSVLAIEEDLLAANYSAVGTFGGTLVPIVRLNIGDEPLIPSSTKLPTLADNSMLISPNPAVDFVNVALDLEEMAKGATLEIIDMNGKTQNMIDMNNVQKDSKNFLVGGLSSGTYYIRLVTENGQITKPFQVIK